jgi:hypothetical protein
MHVDRHAQQFRIRPKILELSGGPFACRRLAIKPALSEALKQYYNKTISRNGANGMSDPAAAGLRGKQ